MICLNARLVTIGAVKLVSVNGRLSPGRSGWIKSVHEATNEGDSAYYDLLKWRLTNFGRWRSRELFAPIKPFLGIVLVTLVHLPQE